MSLTSSSTILKYRLALAFLIALFLFHYYKTKWQFHALNEQYRQQIEICQSNSESIYTKLQVVFEHKNQLESAVKTLEKTEKNDIKDLKSSLSRCRLDNEGLKKRLSVSTSTPPPSVPLNTPQNLSTLQDTINMLNNSLVALQANFNRKNIELTDTMANNTLLTKELSDCQLTIEQYVGAVPVAHYSGNDTSFFQRKHKANAALSFDRDTIQLHSPDKLMRGRELAERLEKKRKEMQNEQQVHPEDRNVDDEYVAEAPNKNDPDYKEGP